MKLTYYLQYYSDSCRKIEKCCDYPSDLRVKIFENNAFATYIYKFD